MINSSENIIIEINKRTPFTINGRIYLLEVVEGNIFLLCHKNGDPFFYLCIRDEFNIGFGMFLKDDNLWINEPITTIDERTINFKINIIPESYLHLSINGKREKTIGDIKGTYEGSCLLIIGKSDKSPNNVSTSKFGIFIQ